MKGGGDTFSTSGFIHFVTHSLTWIYDFVLLHLLASTIKAVSFEPSDLSQQPAPHIYTTQTLLKCPQHQPAPCLYIMASCPCLCQLPHTVPTNSLPATLHTHTEAHTWATASPKPAEMKRLWITQLLNFDQSGNKCK